MSRRHQICVRVTHERGEALRAMARDNGFASVYALVSAVLDAFCNEADRRAHVRLEDLTGLATPIETMYDNVTRFRSHQRFVTPEAKEAKDRGGSKGRRARYGKES